MTVKPTLATSPITTKVSPSLDRDRDHWYQRVRGGTKVFDGVRDELERPALPVNLRRLRALFQDGGGYLFVLLGNSFQRTPEELMSPRPHLQSVPIEGFSQL